MNPFSLRAVAIVAIVCALASPAAGDACPDHTAEQRAIAAALRADAAAATDWTWWWSTGYFVAGIGAITLAQNASEGVVSERTRYGLYVTTIKALIGAYARIVVPLRVPVPRGCEVDRAMLAKAARKERNTALFGIAGGLALNTAGLLYLGLGRDDWRTGWISFASGTIVGVVTLWTQPRRAWSLRRKLDRGGAAGANLGVAPIVPLGEGGFGGLSLVGTW